MWTRIGIFCVVLVGVFNHIQCDLENVTEPRGDAQGYGMRFRLPFIDIDIQSVSNLKIIKDASGQQLFILHGAEFYQVILERGTKRLTLIAILNGGIREADLLGAEIISWNNHVLLVIATDDHFEVYQFAKTTIEERASNHDENAAPLAIDPIQQITIHGQYRGLYLFPSADDSVTLIVFVGYTKLYSRLSTFEWMDTFFEASEEKTIAPVQSVSLIGSDQKYLIATRMSKSQNTVSIIVYDVSSGIEQVQTMQLPAKSVQAFTYQERNYLIACSSGQQKCTYFKMKSGQFSVSKKRPSSEFQFDRISAGEHFIVGQKGNDVSVYVNARMDCYGTFRSDNDDVTKILTHTNPAGHEFIVLSYIRPFTALVRIVEIEHETGRAGSNETVDDVDDVGSALKQQKHAFEETINRLRGLLLSRKYLLDEIKQSIATIRAKERDIVVNGTLHIRSGKIGVVKIVGSKLRSPLEILEKLKDLKKGNYKSRVSRNYQARVNQSLTPDFKVRKLRVGNLIYNGVLLEGFNLSADGSVLKISKPVVANILETKELLSATVMQSRLPRQFHSRSVGSPAAMRIRELRVNRINDVPWNEFYESLFLRSRDRTIHGRLIMQSTVEIGNLTTASLNGMPTDRIFNLVEEQNITSDIIISRFFTSDLTVDSLNGLDFARDVARSGANNFILSPVLARDISVTGKFILSDKDQQARHVFGTSVLDFQQLYTGRVIIDGSLTLRNLEMEPGSRMLVNGREAPVDIAKHFWMYSMPQTFEVPIRFANCLVSAPTLNTLHINSHPVASYLLTSGQQNVENVLLIFLSAHIDGSLVGDPAMGSKLRRISNNALRVGDPMIVSGDKAFLGNLTIDHAEISTLNDLPTGDLVSPTEQSVVFTGTKTFQSIYVSDEAQITHDLRLTTGQLFDDQFPSEDNRFGTVVFRSPLKAKNIVFNYLNGFAAKKIFSGMEISDDKIVLHKDLFIEGNSIFQSSLQLETINGILWDEYLESVVRTNENTLITGSKTFSGPLKIVSELETPFINDLDVDSFHGNYLSKSRFQEISGNYTFGNLQLNNIDVPFINGLATTEFIDTRSPQVIFTSELVMKSLDVRGSFSGNLGVDLQSFVDRIGAIDYESVRNLHVLGNAHWPWGDDQQSLDLQYLFENAVSDVKDQVITGRVRLKKPLINVMKTKQAFPKDIDISFIASDCLLLNSTVEEVVLAAKVFQRPIEIIQAKAMSRLGVKTVNRVDIAAFNSSIYRLSDPSPLQGPLTFRKPPIFGYLNVEGTVNGMPPDGIFLAYEGQKWPPTSFNRLHVEADVRLNVFDNMNLDFLLANRVRKSGPAQEIFGHLTFEELVVEKDASIQSINNIRLDSIVYSDAQYLQEVTGEKTIEGELQLLGPTVVGRLNGESVIERYRKTIFLDRNYNFDSLSIERAEFLGGLIVNGHAYGNHVNGSSGEESWRQHEQVLKHIESNLDKTEKLIERKTTNSKRLMYLDYDFSAATEWKTANDTIQEVFTFDDNRYQYCDREQTIIKWSRYHNRFYISKTITNTVRANAYGTEVTAVNVCKDGYRSAHSVITITEPHFRKQLKINNLVQSIEMYYAGGIYILLHVIDTYAGNNEIRTLKIDNNLKTIQDWQLLTEGVGKISKLFKLQSQVILVVSTVIDNYPSIAIYSLNADTQVFEMTQVVDGDFDIIDLAQISPHKYHLLLSCARCQRIVIFEYDSQASTADDCHMYHIYQVIKLKTRIDRFKLFALPDGGMYMLVLSDRDIDFYHVYKYQYVQGWKHYTYGYFSGIQNAYPLLRDGVSIVDDNLLLLCNRKCTLVKAYYQG